MNNPGSFESHGKNWQPGSVDPHSYEPLEIRRLAQLSLRRIGVALTPLPAYRFVRISKDQKYEPQQPAQKRSGTWNKATTKMTAEEILQLLGAPDFVGRGEWQYDIEGDKPLTLKITWEGQRVKKVARTPAQWLVGTDRDEALAN